MGIRYVMNEGVVEERNVDDRTDRWGENDRVGGLFTNMEQPIRPAGAIDQRKSPPKFSDRYKPRKVLRRGSR
jgi:hypothetical protein